MQNRDDPFDIGQFTLDVNNAWSLPAPYYLSPEVFEAEKQAIFFKSWRFIGHLSEFQNPGDYRTEDICGAGVFVIRTGDGTLCGFHNVCRHRAHQLLGERKGNVDSYIRCPYHAWTYALDGKLRAARNSENVATFSTDTICLGEDLELS